MGGYRHQCAMEGSGCKPTLQELVHYPMHAMIINAFTCCEIAERAVASEKRPIVDLGKGERETVGKREGGNRAPITDGDHHPLTVERFNTQTQPLQLRAVKIPQLAFVEKVGNGKFPVKPEGRLEQLPALEVDQNRSVGDKDAHAGQGVCVCSIAALSWRTLKRSNSAALASDRVPSASAL